jgi:hypothetical protein
MERRNGTPRWVIILLVGAVIYLFYRQGSFSFSADTESNPATATVSATSTQSVEQQVASTVASMMTPQNESVPTVAVSTLAAPATMVPTQAPAQPTTPAMTAADERIQHLLSLQPSFESGGWVSWMHAAGFEFETSKVESRQPIEEGLNGQTTVVGLVIRATDLQVNWPSCLTTDRPNEVKTSSQTNQHQPDLTNPSVMYTNIVLNGQGTVYADCSDWGQLKPNE